jgi:hypothetical protein
MKHLGWPLMMLLLGGCATAREVGCGAADVVVVLGLTAADYLTKTSPGASFAGVCTPSPWGNQTPKSITSDRPRPQEVYP